MKLLVVTLLTALGLAIGVHHARAYYGRIVLSRACRAAREADIAARKRPPRLAHAPPPASIRWCAATGSAGRPSTETYNWAGIEATALFPRAAPDELGYFPTDWGKSGWAWAVNRWLAPPDSILRKAASRPPHPLFAESFPSLARTAIAPKWLPSTLQDATYLEHGEGAYRVHLAHFCKSYEREGSRVILKGFVGELAMTIEPAPVEVGSEVKDVLGQAARLYTPADEWIYPYKGKDVSCPPGVEGLFAALRDELLREVAHASSAEAWERAVKRLAIRHGGLQLHYLARGPIPDPGVSSDGRESDVWIWTNGRVAVVGLESEGWLTPTPLFNALQPKVEAAADVALPDGFVEVATWNEWSDADGALVPTEEEATHEYLYFLRSNGTGYRVLVPKGRHAEQMAAAVWLVGADLFLPMVTGYRYDRYHLKPYDLNDAQSCKKALQLVKDRHEGCLRALQCLRGTPCPASFEATRKRVLGPLQQVQDEWKIAWPVWQAALENPSHVTVHFDALCDQVDRKLAEEALGGFGPEAAHVALREACETAGIKVSECHVAQSAPS